MARTKSFITPEGQTALKSEVKCQGHDLLLKGSIQKGIVQHAEYVVQIESEIFWITGDSIMAMSSAEKL